MQRGAPLPSQRKRPGQVLGIGPPIKRDLSPQQILRKELVSRQNMLKGISTASYAPPLADEPDIKGGSACPMCLHHRLDPPVILQKMDNDPLEHKIACPACKHRYVPVLDVNGGAKFVALGPEQTRALYCSMIDDGIIVNGSIDTAFFTTYPHLAWNAYWHSTGPGSAIERVAAFLTILRCPKCKCAALTIEGCMLECQDCSWTGIALPVGIITQIKALF